MPVSGLPTMLECIINTILTESQLASYKIVGNQHRRTTLVLRFDAMIDTSVSTIHHSSPAASFRRKSPSQVLRDRNRQHNHLSSLTTNEAGITTLPPKKENFKSSNIDSTNDIRLPTANNSAYQTKDSVPAVDRSDTDCVLDNSVHNNVDCSADVTHSEHNSNGKVTQCDTPCEDFVQLTNTHSTTKCMRRQLEHEDRLSDSVYNEHTRSHKFSQNYESEDDKHSTNDRHDYDTSETSDSEHSTNDRHDYDTSKSEHSTNDHHDETLDTSDSELDECTREITPISTSQQQDESNEASLCKKLLNFDKKQLQKKDISRETGQYVTEPERNNNITKLLLDTYGLEEIILAETDDLIVEYSANMQKILHFFVKNIENKTDHEYMRLIHINTWTDMTDFVRSEYHEDVLNIMTALPLLKRWIRESLPHPQ